MQDVSLPIPELVSPRMGIEALTRFADREPLQRVHECVLTILALETQPIDPRL